MSIESVERLTKQVERNLAALADKVLQIALMWRLGAGECQNIHVDVRKALRRFAPSIEDSWEMFNGYSHNRRSSK